MTVLRQRDRWASYLLHLAVPLLVLGLVAYTGHVCMTQLSPGQPEVSAAGQADNARLCTVCLVGVSIVAAAVLALFSLLLTPDSPVLAGDIHQYFWREPFDLYVRPPPALS